MAERNVVLLEQTMQHIENNPGDWEQEQWRCGSGMCFAGWAATLAGREWATKNPDGDGAMNIVVKPGEFEYAGPEETYDPETGRTKTGRLVESVPEVAQHDLGLTSEESDILFDGYNTRTGLRMMVDALKAGEPITYEMQVPDPTTDEEKN